MTSYDRYTSLYPVRLQQFVFIVNNFFETIPCFWEIFEKRETREMIWNDRPILEIKPPLRSHLKKFRIISPESRVRHLIHDQIKSYTLLDTKEEQFKMLKTFEGFH